MATGDWYVAVYAMWQYNVSFSFRSVSILQNVQIGQQTVRSISSLHFSRTWEMMAPKQNDYAVYD